jgi:hypothetical protein
MPDARDDLRATSEAIEDDAERLRDLEVQKQALDPADPTVVALSKEAEDLTQGIAHKATSERELSEEIQGQ